MKQIQRLFTQNIRNPQNTNPVKNVPAARMKVYQKLVYNNIASILNRAFPVIVSILTQDQWAKLIHQFIKTNQAGSPYFYRIPKQFVDFLENDKQAPLEYPFLPELAHYEWIEIEVELETDRESEPKDLTIKPTVRVLSYQYPVHKISKNYLPQKPEQQPVFLVVYRDTNFKVKFMEINVLTACLLEKLASTNYNLETALNAVAKDLGLTPDTKYFAAGKTLCQSLIEKNILGGQL